MGQSGWRLPDDLLRRVRVRCAEEGVRQNAWVEGALEKALADGAGGEPRTAAVVRVHETEPAPSRASAKPKPPALGKGLVASRPKGK
jgi:plasmid stability protein